MQGFIVVTPRGKVLTGQRSCQLKRALILIGAAVDDDPIPEDYSISSARSRVRRVSAKDFVIYLLERCLIKIKPIIELPCDMYVWDFSPRWGKIGSAAYCNGIPQLRGSRLGNFD